MSKQKVHKEIDDLTWEDLWVPEDGKSFAAYHFFLHGTPVSHMYTLLPMGSRQLKSRRNQLINIRMTLATAKTQSLSLPVRLQNINKAIEENEAALSQVTFFISYKGSLSPEFTEQLYKQFGMASLYS